jgi:hypothetical protein
MMGRYHPINQLLYFILLHNDASLKCYFLQVTNSTFSIEIKSGLIINMSSTKPCCYIVCTSISGSSYTFNIFLVDLDKLSFVKPSSINTTIYITYVLNLIE